MFNLLKFLTTSWLLRGDFVIKTSPWSISESVFDDFKNARKTFFGLSVAIAHRFSLDLMSPLERHIFMWSVFALVRCVKPQCVSNAITFYCKLLKVIKNGGKQDFASCWSIWKIDPEKILQNCYNILHQIFPFSNEFPLELFRRNLQEESGKLYWKTSLNGDD